MCCTQIARALHNMSDSCVQIYGVREPTQTQKGSRSSSLCDSGDYSNAPTSTRSLIGLFLIEISQQLCISTATQHIVLLCSTRLRAVQYVHKNQAEMQERHISSCVLSLLRLEPLIPKVPIMLSLHYTTPKILYVMRCCIYCMRIIYLNDRVRDLASLIIDCNDKVQSRFCFTRLTQTWGQWGHAGNVRSGAPLVV